jgi:hypothetical protein
MEFVEIAGIESLDQDALKTVTTARRLIAQDRDRTCTPG